MLIPKTKIISGDIVKHSHHKRQKSQSPKQSRTYGTQSPCKQRKEGSLTPFRYRSRGVKPHIHRKEEDKPLWKVEIKQSLSQTFVTVVGLERLLKALAEFITELRVPRVYWPWFLSHHSFIISIYFMSGFQLPMSFDDVRVWLDMPVRPVFNILVVVEVEACYLQSMVIK